MSAAVNVETANDRARPLDGSPSPHHLDPGQTCRDDQSAFAGVDHLSSGAKVLSESIGPAPRSTPDAVGHMHDETHNVVADGYLHLRAIAEVYEDIQQTRIAVNNRIDRAPIAADLLAAGTVNLENAEHQIGLVLVRTYRRVVDPAIVEWQRTTLGIGEKSLARLLGIIGHPVRMQRHSGSRNDLRVIEERDRTISELWSYCGHGDPKRRPRRGMSQEEAFTLGSPRAKKCVWLLATACVKEKRSPFRVVYDDARIRYADRVHADPCVRCGPSGRPAAEGSPWSAAHQHAAALRLTGKEILRDLWLAAR